MGQIGTGVGSDKGVAMYVHQCHGGRDERVGERVDEVDGLLEEQSRSMFSGG